MSMFLLWSDYEFSLNCHREWKLGQAFRVSYAVLPIVVGASFIVDFKIKPI